MSERSEFESSWRREARRRTGEWTHTFEGRGYRAFCAARRVGFKMRTDTVPFGTPKMSEFLHWVAAVDVVRIADGDLQDAHLTTMPVERRVRDLGTFEEELFGEPWREGRVADLTGLYDAVFGRLHGKCLEHGHAFDTVLAPQVAVSPGPGNGGLMLVSEGSLVERGIVLDANGQRALALG